MSAADVLSGYGALLATIVGIVQIRHWMQSLELFWVSFGSDFWGPEHSLEASITNPMHFGMYLHFIGIGYGYRPWFAPWTIRHFEITGMRATEGEYLSSLQAGSCTIASGQMLDVHFSAKDFKEVLRPRLSRGFDRKLYLWIEHTKSNKMFRKKLTWLS